MTDLSVTLSCVVITCCHSDCGITFAVPSWWSQKRHEDHDYFYCPNGHRQHFPSKSREEILAERLEARERELVSARAYQDQLKADRDAKERQLISQKGATTRLRNRARAALCPCCRRHFSQMARHLKTKHPDYIKARG